MTSLPTTREPTPDHSAPGQPAEGSATLVSGFRGQARRTPERPAARFEGAVLTYRDLDERSDAVAAALVQEGARADAVVGLFIDRSLDLLVGMLGILKAGAAYLPVDPGYPSERIEFLLTNGGCSTVVTRARNHPALADLQVDIVLTDDVEPAASPEVPVAPGDLAYVIYTSGSTGMPKGTLIEHRSVCRLFSSVHPWFGFDQSSVWTLFHSASFDFSVWEIWGALLHGGCVVIVPEDVTRAPLAFADLLMDENVTMLSQTPSAFDLFAAAVVDRPTAEFPALRHIVFGGERLSVGSLRRWVDRHGLDRPQLVNMYGITETTVHTTYRRIQATDFADPHASPIGCALPDLTLAIVDEHDREVADGTVGELVIGGPGVARGYLGRPDLEAQRFSALTLRDSPSPLRVYRSGDLVVRSGGELFYRGRLDDQIQVRGFRIEPAEVEAHLLDQPGVARCAVIEGPVELAAPLVAFVVFDEPCPAPAGADELVPQVAEALRLRLPAHLVPTHVFACDAIPLSPNGKVDRVRLFREAEIRLTSSSAPPLEDADPVVTQIGALAGSLLARDGVDVHRDLFDQGATSLMFVRLLAAIHQRFGVEIVGPELDGDASVRHLARLVDAALQPDGTP